MSLPETIASAVFMNRWSPVVVISAWCSRVQEAYMRTLLHEPMTWARLMPWHRLPPLPGPESYPRGESKMDIEPSRLDRASLQ